MDDFVGKQIVDQLRELNNNLEELVNVLLNREQPNADGPAS